jgi:hypothetical protein
VGRKPHPRLVAPTQRFDAQVGQGRNQAGQVVEVNRRVVCGGPRRLVPPWRLRQLGTTLQTACLARGYGPLRGRVAPLRRRTRCLAWSRARPRGRLWLLVRLDNCVMPHKSLRQGRTPRTPAMAIGLTAPVWSARESIGLPVHPDPVLTKQMDERMTHLLTPALPPPSAHPQTQSLPRETPEVAGDTRPKAA